MEQEPYSQPAAPASAPALNAFWPVLLLGLSLLLILSWEIWIGMATRRGTQELKAQQVKTVEQATQVQAGLEKLVRGLVDLAKTDEQAQKLVTKFGIKVNNPTVPESTPIP